MEKQLFLKPFVYLSRFCIRKGCGIHSPFAFDLVTRLIFEKAPYYAYATLPRENLKINRLLFRLVNYAQPHYLIEMGEQNGATTEYLRAAKQNVHHCPVDDLRQGIPHIPRVDFLYVHYSGSQDLALLKERCDECVRLAHSGSVFVLEGIHRNASMRSWWQEWVNSAQTGITFDLYELGILFFDRGKVKQHYTINF